MTVTVNGFLAHYGVKGMRWGVRRDRSGDSGGEGSAKGLSGVDPDRMRVGSVLVSKDADGSTITQIKTKNGWEQTRLSADAERFLDASAKQPHELSTKQLKDVTDRAKAINDYNKLFGEQPSKELQNKVDMMDLQKRYSKLHAEMNPSRRAQAAALVASAGSLYMTYQKMNKNSNGQLGKLVAEMRPSRGKGGKHKLTAEVVKAAKKAKK